MDLFLASGSPRRLQLLQQLGFQAQKISSDIDETPHDNEDAQAYTERMAWQKSEQALELFTQAHGQAPAIPVLTADTSVAVDGQILGKPNDRQDAYQMLKQLSGRSHQVISAVVVWHQGTRHRTTQISDVTFKTLSDAEIYAYLASGEADDKAGAYGIQGLAAVFISHLDGSFSGVMGLPLFETTQLLQLCHLNCLDI
ncbi:MULTISPECIES: Maf family protein [Vitreoscilla]|uniref:dTTP/UTP pyrophosphatase n=1 Tax=Vitreoscilla stercoraria TaxID=61 RepID=A0ABY4EC09_VITST|nr:MULTISPECIES: nucleoside triphosphate pyrophosphatase [Vitreoscilla]QJQ52344.1 Maf-like protein [Vitreoscilla sp. C1]UOO92987.1 Maf family protein [Vitreoscilla stercoraria]